MSESPRQAFLDKAAEVLSTMSGTRFWGGPYNTTPKVEVGEARQFQDVGTLPWIGLLPAPGAQTDIPAMRGADALMFDQFRVLIFGYVDGDGTINRSLWMQRLIRDIQRTLRQTNAFAAFRPGTTFPYASSFDFEEEDVTYHADGTGAEFVLPLLVRIPDDLST
jgi:hypothetical protein